VALAIPEDRTRIAETTATAALMPMVVTLCCMDLMTLTTMTMVMTVVIMAR
jgi:hypothetical protein